MRRLAILFLLACAPEGTAGEPLSFQAILVAPEELPEGVQSIQGVHTVAPHPHNFFLTPSVKEIAKILPPEFRKQIPKGFFEGFPEPVRKQAQSFLAEGGAKGTVFLFEYATTDLSLVLDFLTGILYGQEGRCDEHPDEVIVRERFLWIVSFPQGDPGAEWYKQRLRQKLAIPALREHKDLAPLQKQLFAAEDAGDADTGLLLLKKHAEAVEDWALGQTLLGGFALMKRNPKLAEKSFRKAVTLHETLTDPLEPILAWRATDGLGLSLHRLGKRKDAVQKLRRALDLARKLGEEDRRGPTAQTHYDLARAYAKWRKYPDSLRALKEAIAGDGKYLDEARTDPDFSAARRRKEFKALLR